MAITEACYTTREQVKSALDVKATAYNNDQIDRAIQSASRSIDGQLHRVFYNTLTTKYVDWPNFQYAYPWRIWLDAAELADVTSTVPVVTSGGHVIASTSILWGHPRYAPPYTYLELDRSTTATFGQGSTPQRDVAITGVFGFDLRSAPAGTLAGAMSDAVGTAATVTNAALVGVGDTVIVGSERMLVTEKAWTTTAQTLQASLTDLQSDTVLAVTDGTKYAAGEPLLLDAETVMVRAVSGNNLIVERAVDGSVLAAHVNPTLYAPRLLTVVRGSFGTTAASHLSAAVVSKHCVPSLVADLAVAEAVVRVAQESGAYAQSQGSGETTWTGVGRGISDIRAQCLAAYGRTSRSRTV